jgi:hypothetical protein
MMAMLLFFPVQKLEVTMQSMGQVKAELEAERSKATVAVGDTELVRLTPDST